MMVEYGDSDEHLAYLVHNCGVRGYDIPDRAATCTRPDVDVILRYVEWLGVAAGERVLEVGCGIGRILKELHDMVGVRGSGVDRTGAIIAAARQRVGAITEELRVGTAERTGFADGQFDRIVCWGVYDLCDQTAALAEMARILKPGGTLLLTGKNDTYRDDDSDAAIAEEMARRKGVDNHFSDFDALIGWAARLGLAPAGQRFFPRRGDMMQDRFAETRPERFYEYALLLQRREVFPLPEPGGVVIGRPHSRTAARRLG